jgi:predicted hotdog family 3-hydroxylacyl-ACP dehydratase
MISGDHKQLAGKDDILSLIPQRPPMVMVDSLIFADEKSSTTVFEIPEGNIFVEFGRLTEPGLLENMAQTAAAGIGYICRVGNRPVPLGYIGAVQNLEIFGLPKTGDEIETEILVENQIFEVSIVSGRVRLKGKILAQCKMKIFTKQP